MISNGPPTDRLSINMEKYVQRRIESYATIVASPTNKPLVRGFCMIGSPDGGFENVPSNQITGLLPSFRKFRCQMGADEGQASTECCKKEKLVDVSKESHQRQLRI